MAGWQLLIQLGFGSCPEMDVNISVFSPLLASSNVHLLTFA